MYGCTGDGKEMYLGEAQSAVIRPQCAVVTGITQVARAGLKGCHPPQALHVTAPEEQLM